MLDNLKNNAEQEFHSRRKAFVVFAKGILTADDGFTGSHRELLIQCGFNDSQATEIINTCPRGYALKGNVFLYQGENFACLTVENKKRVEKLISYFKKNHWLSETGSVYDGMVIGQTGEQWKPVKEF